MPLKDPTARRAYQLAWERKKYAGVKRERTLTPQQKLRKKECERVRRANGTRANSWEKSPAAKIYKRESARRWRAKNPDKVREVNFKAYRKRLSLQPDYYRKWAQNWSDNNRETKRAKGRKYYNDNRDAVLALNKGWRQRNPAKVLAFSQAARARRRNAVTENCSKKIAVLKRERFCHWCCTAITPKTVHVDHVIPLARGGKHCNDNLVASCLRCNTSRKAKLISEWTWEAAA